MLQNRVTPLGEIIRTKARGTWMGNRGLLHNRQQEINRGFRLKAWITCKLEFKNRERPVMAPGQYTELFFLDEATAFSAGHRPCAECRRDDFIRFKSMWTQSNPIYGFDLKTPIAKIDEIIHGERMNADGSKKTFETNRINIPDGTFILHEGSPYMIKENQMYRWVPEGYGNATDLPGEKKLTVLTPESVMNVLRQGYIPQINL